jgi:hypothetical protein
MSFKKYLTISIIGLILITSCNHQDHVQKPGRSSEEKIESKLNLENQITLTQNLEINCHQFLFYIAKNENKDIEIISIKESIFRLFADIKNIETIRTSDLPSQQLLTCVTSQLEKLL